MSKILLLFAATFAVNLLSANRLNAQLNEERFKELMSSVVPDEKFSQIEWQSDLLLAQKIALQQKKPMFIWSMDGNPLGCT